MFSLAKGVEHRKIFCDMISEDHVDVGFCLSFVYCFSYLEAPPLCKEIGFVLITRNVKMDL